MARGQLESLAEVFQCPVPIYLEGRLILEHRTARIVQYLRLYRAFAQRERVTRYVPTILQIEDQTDRRLLTRVRWDHIRPDGSLFDSSIVRYVFCKGEHPGRARIELVEYLTTSFEGLCDALYPPVPVAS